MGLKKRLAYYHQQQQKKKHHSDLEHPFIMHVIDDARNYVESPLSSPHCMNEECRFKISF
jgi:hypothetical protein